MPFTTEFDAVKLGFTSVAVKLRLPSSAIPRGRIDFDVAG